MICSCSYTLVWILSVSWNVLMGGEGLHNSVARHVQLPLCCWSQWCKHCCSINRGYFKGFNRDTLSSINSHQSQFSSMQTVKNFTFMQFRRGWLHYSASVLQLVLIPWCMMINAVVKPSFVLSDIYCPDTLPKVCMLSLSLNTQQKCGGAGHIHWFQSSFLVPIFTTAIHHILFFHRVYMFSLFLWPCTTRILRFKRPRPPPSSPSDPPMKSAASLPTSATLRDLCAPPALHSAPIFSCAH